MALPKRELFARCEVSMTPPTGGVGCSGEYRSAVGVGAVRKLEVEGASNPAIYDDAFPDALRAYVLGA